MAASRKQAVSSSRKDDPEPGEGLYPQHDEGKVDTFGRLSSLNSEKQLSDEETASFPNNQPETHVMSEESNVLNRPRSRSSPCIDLDKEEMDFCSPKFNAALALKSENVTVPSPNILTFESLTSYEEAVKRRRQQRTSAATVVTLTKKSQNETRMSASSSTTPSSRSRSVDSKPSLSRSSVRSSDTQRTRGDIDRPTSDKDLGLKSTFGSRSRTSLRKKEIQQDKEETSDRSTTPERKSDHKVLTRVYEERWDNQKRSSTFPTFKADESAGSTSSTKQGRKERKNVFTRMEEVSGPLSLLTRCVKNKEHVRVVTRGAVSLNSICRGYIVAFDKYLNMAMIDVDEIYRRPAELGKVKARISHRLLDAQQTLKKERDECQARWRSRFTQRNRDGKTAVASNPDRKHSFLAQDQEQSKQIDLDDTKSSVGHQQSSGEFCSSERLGSASGAIDKRQSSCLGVVEAENSGSSKLNPKLLQSVYSSLSTPLSRYEREALMLGVPDENVEHRHLNQLLLRGENIVSVSIIEEF